MAIQNGGIQGKILNKTDSWVKGQDTKIMFKIKILKILSIEDGVKFLCIFHISGSQAGVIFALLGRANVCRNVIIIKTGEKGCHWHLVGRGEGCC